MKRNLIALSLTAAGLFASGLAMAANSTTVTVSATVIGNCKFNTPGPTTLTIANSGVNIDPSITGTATGSASVTFRCTKNTSSSVSVGVTPYAAPVTRTLTSGANTMSYTFTLSGFAQTGTGFGTGGSDLTLGLQGDIADTEYQAAAAGLYSDTITLNINP